VGVSAVHRVAPAVDVCCAWLLLLQFAVFTFHTTIQSLLCWQAVFTP